MPPAHYNCILPAESYDGDVGTIRGTIRVRWSNSAMQRLHEVAGEGGVPVTTMKAACEHLAYMCAERLGNSQALIRGPPHTFTVNSGNNTVQPDDNHITAELNGGTGKRSWVHIYLGGVISGPNGYDNAYAVSESVFTKVKGHKVLDANLSRSFQGGGTAAAAGAQSSYVMAGSSSATAHAGSSSSGQGGTYTEWQLASDGQTWIRYNHGRSRWEDQAGQAWGGSQEGGGSGAATSGASGWGSTYTTTGGYQAGGGSGQESTSGESPWVWSAEYQRYYNRVTGEWGEPQ